jgi:hypothetical protein
MKSIVSFALIILAVVASPTVYAGRDALQLTEQDKANKEAIARRSDSNSAASGVGKAQVLDHGPRATTTQWQNRQQNKNAATPAD